MSNLDVTNASRYVHGGVSWLFALAALLLIQTTLASKAWALVSDDFSQELLDTATWTAVDPVGNSTIETAGSRLLLNVPAGSSHDAWTSGNNSARVIQFISNTDFELEVKFESGIEVPGKIQGILVEESANNYLRFDVTKVGTEARIYATAMVNNAAALQKNKAISAGSPLYMRVKRLGNQWTQLLSYDGVVWSPINVFSHPLAVTAVGVFAGNSGGASAPQHTAMVDYFFSTANPISPEDGEIIADTTAPFIRDIKTITGINQFEVRWQTDEPASARLEYGPTTSYGAVIENIELERQHTLVAPGLASDTTYHYRLRSRDANGNEQVSGDYTVRVSPDPFLTIWNGSSQFFGQLGSNAQRWVNILGDVSSASAISTLEYSLNGGAARPLSLGPDGLRLQNTNDFTIDIDHLELLDGSNTLAITASNSTGRAKTENIALNYASNNNWPLPYFIDWSTVSRLENVAQVVDGKWQVSNGAVRTAQLGYDRLLNIGDISWDNYEVTVPVTLHNVDQSCLVDLNNNPCNGGPLFGFLMRWQGHQLDGQQPHSEWKPLGALGAYLWRTDATAQEARPGLYLFGGTGQIINRNYARDVPVGVTHIFKMRAETTGIEHQYKFKMWQAGQTEPSAWDLQGAQNFNESLGNGSLLLLAHYADVSFGNVQVMPLGGSPDTNAPVISNVIVSAATETTATITWTTDEAANSQVDYGLSTTYDKTGSSAGFVTSHSITLTGLAPNTLHHFRVSSTDASGNAANGIDLTFTTTSPGGGVSPSGLVSDGFDDSSLNGRWTWADSAGDSTVSVNGSQLVIAVPAGTNHNLWNGTLDQAPRVRQAANNTDLVLEVKFDSTVSRKYQMQGITVEQDANNLLRFDFFSDGTLTYVYAASIVNGLATKRIQKTIINGAPLYLRVTRVGNQWTEAYSYDGANWTTAGTFAHTLAVSSAAIYGGNFSTGTPPAHTVLVDYFTVDNLPPGSGGGDTTAPVISNVVVSAITATSATISWTTDETASSRVNYGLDTTYGQTANGNGPVTSHSVTLTNLVPGTLHHYRVSSSDASGNTANGTDRTFTTLAGGDTTAPVISNVVVSAITATSATIGWTTDETATSQVNYGLDTTYGQTANGNGPVTSHSVTLTNLVPGTLHHYRASSSDASGNTANGTDRTFTTLAGGDTTAPVISNVVVSAITATSATISWTTDETASSRVDYGLDTTYGQTANGNGPVTSHSVTLTNLVPGTLHHYRASSSDASGNTANGTDRTFTTTSPGGGVSPSGLVSDGFDDSSLNGRWTWADSAGDSTVSVNGSQLVIAVPAGTNHNLWNGTLDQAPRVRQAANNTDLVLEVKFDSTVSRKYQMQGITVEQDANNLLRFDFFSDGTLTYVYAASIVNGLATKRIQKTIINGAPLYLRVTRVGNQWTEAYSYDGANWTTAGTFAHTLAVSSAAIYGGNFSTGTPPAHTVLVDYFTVDNLPPGSGGGDTTAPVISNVVVSAITATSATISWTTDEAANSQVDYGLSTTYDRTSSSAGFVTSHSITLTGLAPDTLHHFQVSSTDSSGNTADSVDLTLTTAFAGDVTPPSISSVFVSALTDTTATITWTTDEAANSQVDYGLSASYDKTSSSAGFVTSHSITLTGLAPNTLHHFQVSSIDSSGNAALGVDLTFTTTQAIDTTGPVISNVVVSAITATSATISWTTDETASSRVDYGLDTTYGQTANGNGPVTSHSVTLTNLVPGTLHHYRASSSDASGNTANGTDRTFTTLAGGDTTAPVISNIVVSGVTETSATISWTTNEDSDSNIEYGADTEYGLSANDPTLTNTHSITLTGLASNTLYQYRVSSTDAVGNTSTAANFTFTTNSSSQAATAVAIWPLNEGTGNFISDTSGNGYFGSLINNPTWMGDALSFDGVDDYVDAGSIDVTGTAITITGWFKSDNLANCAYRDCRIISKAVGTATDDHHLMVSTVKVGGATRLRFRLKTDTTTDTLIASTNLSNHVWFHFAAVYDGNTMNLYINGSLAGSIAKTGNIPSAPDTPLWLGGNPPTATGRPWDGMLSDIRIYNGALTSQELNAVRAEFKGVNMVAFEVNRAVTVDDHGFPLDEPPAIPANGDWTAPFNYGEGTFYLRAEIRNQPIAQNMRLQFCIWQYELVLESCTSLQSVQGNVGTVVTWSQSIESMFKKDGNPIDWANPRQMYGIAIKNQIGEPVSDFRGWDWSGENPAEWYPLDAHITVVVVPKGASFAGWDKIIQ